MSQGDLNEEDYLKRHLNNAESVNKPKKQENNREKEEVIQGTTTKDLDYFNFDIDQLPCGDFYPEGSILMVRPAEVYEIQSYSMVDDSNFYDVVEKMNHMLKSCVRIKYNNGEVGSYLDIKDQDRIFIIFLIRQLTFQEGNDLTIDAQCECEKDVKIELKTKNFKFNEITDKFSKYYNAPNGYYKFNIKNGNEYKIAPPTIGIQKSFTNYLIEKRKENEKKKPNLSFMKIIPFLLPNKNSITTEGIDSKLEEFENMDPMSFQFLNSVISKLKFGIDKVSKKCECGEEVATDMVFPKGASGIFVIHDAFEAYIEE